MLNSKQIIEIFMFLVLTIQFHGFVMNFLKLIFLKTKNNRKKGKGQIFFHVVDEYFCVFTDSFSLNILLFIDF